MLVLLYHAWEGPSRQLGIDNPIVDAISLFGFAGVDLLFVVSGFIIFFTTDKPPTANAPLIFIYQRAVRVYLGYWPFYLLAIAAFALLNPARLAEADLLSSFFLLPDKQGETLINPTWTLAYELYFYVLFFLLMHTAYRIQWMAILFVLILGFNLFAALALDAYTWKGFKNLGEWQRFLTSPWLLEFFMGSFAAWAVRHSTGRFAVTAVVLGASCFLLAATLNAIVFDGKIARFFNYHYRMSLFGGGSALLLYGAVILESRGIVLWPRFSLLLGGATYSIYLSHTIIMDSLGFAGIFARVQSSAFSPLLFYVLMVVAIIVLATQFYLLLEKPVYRRARKQIYKIL